jgi:uracil-DNA glycosylase
MTESLASKLPELLKGVHPGWVKFLENKGLVPLARKALSKISPDAGELAPRPNLIFEFLRYFGPDDATVLIVGQDPYPTDAQGLCFSIPVGATMKASLQTIIGNLENNAQARAHYRVRNVPDSGRVYSGDLRTWAVQGVLLMNSALTTRAGARGSHRSHWKAFTRKFVRELALHAAAQKKPLVFMLWGNDARSYASSTGTDNVAHIVYEWTHPSPLINNRLAPARKFEASPQFALTNANLRERNLRDIDWDPLAYTIVFTDGSCPKNGDSDAEASFALGVLSGPLKHVWVAGRVAPQEYKLVDSNNLARGFKPVPETKAVPTNNRGEYLAWCWALLLLLRGKVVGRTEIVSDSDLFIQTMKTWLPARRCKGTEKKLKNYDLIYIADALLHRLREGNVFKREGVKLTHTRSHQKRPPPTASSREQVLWIGNDMVDKEAGDILKTSDPFVFKTKLPALEWQLIKRYE